MAWGGGEIPSGDGKKPAPSAFNIDIMHYAAAVEWLKGFVLKNYGMQITEVVHDAYANSWRCYDSEHGIITNVEHDLMQRLALVLEQIEWLWAEKVQHDHEDELREIFGEDDGA